MPYIKQTDRRDLVTGKRKVQTPGELNFMLSLFARSYIDEHGLSYQSINDVLGALEGAKAEFYRKVAAPYEDKKIATNGGLYETLSERPNVGHTEVQHSDVRASGEAAESPGA